MSETPHTLLTPAELGPTAGYSHGVLAAAGRTLYVAGQVGADEHGAIVAGGIAAQFDAALSRVATVLAAAGATAEQLVSMTIFCTDVGAYRSHREQIGAAYRAHLGRHFPAMALVGVTELVDPAAVVEISAIAVIPSAGAG